MKWVNDTPKGSSNDWFVNKDGEIYQGAPRWRKRWAVLKKQYKAGAYVHPPWFTASVFKKWHDENDVPEGWFHCWGTGYTPSTCAIFPKAFALTLRWNLGAESRRHLPKGVDPTDSKYPLRTAKPYRVRISYGGMKSAVIGYANTRSEGLAIYIQAKMDHLRELAEDCKNECDHYDRYKKKISLAVAEVQKALNDELEYWIMMDESVTEVA